MYFHSPVVEGALCKGAEISEDQLREMPTAHSQDASPLWIISEPAKTAL